jgi:hypothetical protein
MIVDRLLGARDEETGAPLDMRALRNEAAVLLMAGHETTANTLAWTWYILSQAPDVEARLHAEVDRMLEGRPPTLGDVPNLVYTRAVFEEVLRLYPTVPLLTARRTIPHLPHPQGITVVCPWAAAPTSDVLAAARSFHSRALPARRSSPGVEIRLDSFQHRSAHLHRGVVRIDRGDPVDRHHCAEIHVAARPGPSCRGGLPSDSAAGRQIADAADPAPPGRGSHRRCRRKRGGPPARCR